MFGRPSVLACLLACLSLCSLKKGNQELCPPPGVCEKSSWLAVGQKRRFFFFFNELTK